MQVSLTPQARRILRYLQRNPQAQDTLEGIVQWWLLDLQIEEGEREVQAALDELQQAGLVLESTGADLETRYRLNRRHPEAVRLLTQERGEVEGHG